MIELRKLTKSFGSKYALRGVNLRVMPGESLVIFGPNGAGKSTLIRILSSLSRPTSGTRAHRRARSGHARRRHPPPPGRRVACAAALRQPDRRGEPALLRRAVRHVAAGAAHHRAAGAGRADHPPRRPGPHLLARHGATAGDRPGAAARSAGAAAGRAGHRPRPAGRGDAARLAGAGERRRHGDTGTRGRRADDRRSYTPTRRHAHTPRRSARSSR